MTAQLLDGAAVAQQIKQSVAARVAKLAAHQIRPGLAAVIVGSNPAS
jgi:methylenetetrahydrofolate dehydrogenase (NADP+)/methenyltetrahydrofolate cyclohydrolase